MGFGLSESVPCALGKKETPIQLLRQRVYLGSVCQLSGPSHQSVL